MAFDIGVNFRGTSGYVTDGANETYCLADSYPTTRGGATFGWEDAVTGGANRDNTLDRRLAGINYTTTTGTGFRFRIDLPASGSVDVHCALGDPPTGNAGNIDVKDGTTLLFSTTGGGFIGGNKWIDAQSSVLTNVTWPTSEAAHTVTMSGTTFRAVLSGPGSPVPIAFLRVVQAGGGGGGGGGVAPSNQYLPLLGVGRNTSAEPVAHPNRRIFCPTFCEKVA